MIKTNGKIFIQRNNDRRDCALIVIVEMSILTTILYGHALAWAKATLSFNFAILIAQSIDSYDASGLLCLLHPAPKNYTT